MKGVLSQHQSREDIQALLTVLFIRNYSFLNRKTQKGSEKSPKPKSNNLPLLSKAYGLVINWVFLQTSYYLWTELTESRFTSLSVQCYYLSVHFKYVQLSRNMSQVIQYTNTVQAACDCMPNSVSRYITFKKKLNYNYFFISDFLLLVTIQFRAEQSEDV